MQSSALRIEEEEWNPKQIIEELVDNQNNNNNNNNYIENNDNDANKNDKYRKHSKIVQDQVNSKK